MYSFSTESIVLKRRNFGEADKLVTFFTKKKGKVMVLAKGVRKVSSRRAPNIEQLNQVNIFLHKNRSLPILSEAAEIQSFPKIKASLEKLSLAYLLLELVDRFLEEEQESSQIYDLLVKTLESLENTSDLEKCRVLQTSFQIKLLNEVGYLPQLYHCANCRQELLPTTNYLSPSLGGIIDEVCNQNTLLSKKMTVDGIKTLRFLEKEPFALVEKLNLENKVVAEAGLLLNYYTSFFLEKDLNSLQFAQKIQLLNSPQ